MYHKAYQQAMEQQLYTTDDSGSEVDGEPVPTLQADEYLAMAMHRWFGSGDGSEEYKAQRWERHGGSGRGGVVEFESVRNTVIPHGGNRGCGC